MQRSFSKAIFLDIGGVLLNNAWGHGSRQAAVEEFGYDYQEMEWLHQFTFNVYETGGITLDEYLDRVLFYQPRNFIKQRLEILCSLSPGYCRICWSG